jgi:hypothetical protein
LANPGVIQAENSALNFMSELNGQQMQAFAGNQAALSSLSSAWAPVLATGQVPYGYSPGLDSMLKSNIINQGAQATTNAQNAAELQQRQASGGAPGAAPQGAQEAINAEIQAKGQQATAQNLTNEQIAGYQQGEKNLQGATQAELGIASGENETGLAGATTGAGGLGLNAAQAQWQENQTTSPMNILGDVTKGITDIAGGVTGIGNIGAMFKPSGGSKPSGDQSFIP